MTVVYLSDSKMQVFIGSNGSKPVISKAFTSTEIKDCISNGIITDREKFCHIVSEFFDLHKIHKKDVILVLNSNQIMTRIIKIPAKDDNGTRAYIANEFSQINRASNPVYSYHLIKSNKKTHINEVLAVMADKSMLDTYCSVFKQCDIVISSIESFLVCAVRAINSCADVKSGSSVIQVMEEDGFTSLLYVDSKYVYSSYNRLINDHESTEFGIEVANVTGNIAQFMQAQHIQGSINKILLAGFLKGDKEITESSLMSLISNVEIKQLSNKNVTVNKSAGLNFGDCVYASGAFLGEIKSTSNLLYCAEHEVHQEKNTSFAKKTIIWSVIILFVLAVSSGTVLFIKHNYQLKLDELNAYINSSEIQNLAEQSDALSQQKINLAQMNKSVKTLTEYSATYPLPNSSVNAKLLECAQGLVDIDILQYNSVTGYLKISTTAKDVDQINKFIDILKKQDIFCVHSYSGYEYIDSRDCWSVNVVVGLNGNAGH